MPQFNDVETRALMDCLNGFVNWFLPNIRTLIAAEVPAAETSMEFIGVERSLKELSTALVAKTDGGLSKPVPDKLCPLLKRILTVHRRQEAVRIERLRERTHHLETLGLLDRNIEILDSLIRQPWFLEAQPQRIPNLLDFLPISRVEQLEANQLKLPERKFDEKFHILQAPELFLQDLEYYRMKTDERGTSIAVVFLDIDDFKTFNTSNHETKVDRNLLPFFMKALEAHVYSHGYVYRQGGDEYLILLPNFSKEFAIAFLDELRLKVAKLEYPGIQGRTKVSIGLCVADPNCFLTNRELQEKANIAKQHAKKEGKDRIATYAGDNFERDDLCVVRP